MGCVSDDTLSLYGVGGSLCSGYAMRVYPVVQASRFLSFVFTTWSRA